MKDVRITESKKEGYLISLSNLCNELGKKPSGTDINKCNYTPSTQVYVYNFGGVKQALKLIKPMWCDKGKHHSDEFLKEEFYRVKKIIGQCPSFEEMKKHAKFHPCIIQERFGKWSTFLKELGENRKRKFTTTFKGKKRLFRAKDGHLCHSKMEVKIDNLLYRLGIKHENEINYPIDSIYNKNGLKRCDWKIDDSYVEYCGMMSFYNEKVKQKYEDLITEKFTMCMNNNWNFMFILPDNINNIEKEIINFLGGK